MYGKLLVINWIMIIGIMLLDKSIFGDSLEKTPYIASVLGHWLLISLMAIPVYGAYFVWNL